MNQDLRFPVKYAVLELKSPGGYSTNYEDVTEGYIVSKCYVVGSDVRYFPNGEARVTYKVYFPYDDIDNFIFNGRDVTKMFGIDACNNYYPVHIIERLFDTYEEAKEVAEEQNKNLVARAASCYSISNPDFMEIYEKEKAEIISRLNVCQRYEDFITENTKDLEVTQLDTMGRFRKKIE